MLLSIALIVAVMRASPHTVDACSLLTEIELKAVLGNTVTDRKANTQSAGGLLMSQCVFGTASTHSVSVAVAATPARGRGALTPREYWRRQFHPSAREEREEREAEGENKPRAIDGIGEEAYWAGNRIAGALYVLLGDTFVRISVGGIPNERERIEKSKALARAAIKKLWRLLAVLHPRDLRMFDEVHVVVGVGRRCGESHRDPQGDRQHRDAGQRDEEHQVRDEAAERRA